MNNSQGLLTIRSTVSIYDIDTEQSHAVGSRRPHDYDYPNVGHTQKDHANLPMTRRHTTQPLSITGEDYMEMLALQDWMMEAIHDVYLSRCL